METRKKYPSDLSDQEWLLLEPLIPAAKPGGRRREVDMREVVNGIYYILRSGGGWRMMPHDLYGSASSTPQLIGDIVVLPHLPC
jgi:transposase